MSNHYTAISIRKVTGPRVRAIFATSDYRDPYGFTGLVLVQHDSGAGWSIHQVPASDPATHRIVTHLGRNPEPVAHVPTLAAARRWVMDDAR